MQTTVLAGEIANYAIYQLKNKVLLIREMAVVEQDDVRDVIRNAALHILNEYVGAPKGA
jgi:4-alpha-glucanotransferase